MAVQILSCVPFLRYFRLITTGDTLDTRMVPTTTDMSQNDGLRRWREDFVCLSKPGIVQPTRWENGVHLSTSLAQLTDYGCARSAFFVAFHSEWTRSRYTARRAVSYTWPMITSMYINISIIYGIDSIKSVYLLNLNIYTHTVRCSKVNIKYKRI